MTSARQLEANRGNALKSTGPRTIDGKQASRRNALRHGLTAETLIEPLEDPEAYQEFEAAIVAEYVPQSPVEKELVHRLASLFWRLRRATSIETGLLRRHAKHSGLSWRVSLDATGRPGARHRDQLLAARQPGQRNGRSAQPIRVRPLAPARADDLCFADAQASVGVFSKKGLAPMLDRMAGAELRNEAKCGRARSGGCVRSGYAGTTPGYQKRRSTRFYVAERLGIFLCRLGSRLVRRAATKPRISRSSRLKRECTGGLPRPTRHSPVCAASRARQPLHRAPYQEAFNRRSRHSRSRIRRPTHDFPLCSLACQTYTCYLHEFRHSVSIRPVVMFFNIISKVPAVTAVHPGRRRARTISTHLT